MPILIYILFLIFAMFGYISNITKLINCDFKPSYKAEIIRGVGIIIPPVGVIAGYIAIEDKKE